VSNRLSNVPDLRDNPNVLMLENRIFGAALFLASLLFIFHGCILLFAPNRYLPIASWGEPTIKLVRKPPLEFGKRFAGLCLSVGVFLFFTLPGFSIVLHPKAGRVSLGQSPLHAGSARWDLLGVGIFALVCGYLLLLRPERSVEMMFLSEQEKLEDATTRRLWKLHVQMAGSFFLVWFLLPLGAFISSLR
jgi:hypothetical protein